jgi:1A family penicillin-binding protein
MPEGINETRRSDSAGIEPPRGPPLEREEGRSLMAAREFVHALSVDLRTLLRRLGCALWTASQRKTQASPIISQKRSAFRRAIGGLAKTIAVLVVLGSAATVGAMFWALHDLPAEKPFASNSEGSFLLEAANGETLGRVGPLKLPDATRTDFPDDLVNAVISIEDRHFYSHPGFDPKGILRALRRNINAGGIVEGGSTITQQLVKMRILGHERSLSHKLREALAAVWLDMQMGKDEILTRYLNGVYLGNGAYGMPAAARLYFDKRLSELTLPEAAMLAGLIRSPSRDNPVQNPEGAQARASVVIDAMRDNGTIEMNAAENAVARPAVPHLSRQTLRAGTWFADWASREATAVIGSGNMRLRTTLIPGLQRLAEQALAEILGKEGAQRHASQAALVALRPDGAVVAMVGGRDYRASQFNRAVDAQRQPGSAFKLFVYFAALRKGLTPNDTIDAGPVDIKGWSPENFDDRHYGRMTLADAFAKSINTAAARLAQQVGLNQVIAAARDLGLTGALPAVPSLALGAAEVNLLDLTAAYAAVQAGKMPIRPWGIAGFGVEGQPRLQSMGPPIRPMQSLQPYQQPLLELLQDVLRRGTGRAAALDGFAAGKTGTSQNYRDAWFIGFNDALIVGVWVGNDDRSPMNHVTGGSLPAAIWKRFMTEAGSVISRDTQQPTADTPPNVATSVAVPRQRAGGETADTPPNVATSVGQAPADQAPEAPHCDYQACGRTYRSFRASDCTYQPYSGASRELCDKNTSERVAATLLAPNLRSQPLLDKPGGGLCNIDVCASFYSSFDPADCTYKPYGGGRRRLCTR